MHLPTTVRPRLVWSGTFGILSSMVLIAVANIADSMPWQIVGFAVLVIAGLVALSGGITRDVQGEISDAESEIKDAEKGEAHRGVVPGQHWHDPNAMAQVDARPRPSLIPSAHEMSSAAVGGLMLVGVWLMLAHNILSVPFEPQARGVTLREVSVAVVIVLSAVLLGQHGRSWLASGICALAGVLLGLAAVAVDSLRSVQINDLMSGIVIIVLAAITLIRPKRPRRPWPIRP